MSHNSEVIQKLIEQFSKLPSIGQKSAERLVFYLLAQDKSEISQFANVLNEVNKTIRLCDKCQNFSENSPCKICSDPKRSLDLVCVVATPQDLLAIEKSGDYQGTYHILGGVIDALDGITAEKLKVKQLINRIKNDNISEIILGLNPDMPGETTMLYLTKIVKELGDIKVTRLARGLPVGSDLEYADEVTLSSALKGRREV